MLYTYNVILKYNLTINNVTLIIIILKIKTAKSTTKPVDIL